MNNVCKTAKGLKLINKYARARLIAARVAHLSDATPAPLFIDLAQYPEIQKLKNNKILAIARLQFQLGFLNSYLSYEFIR